MHSSLSAIPALREAEFPSPKDGQSVLANGPTLLHGR